MKIPLVIILFGLVALTVAKEEDEEIDWKKLEKELLEAPFVEIDTEPNLQNGINGSCKCIGDDECGCCVAPTIFKKTLPGCIEFQYHNAENSLNVSLQLLDKTPISHEFPVGGLKRLCVSLPYARFIGLCLVTATSESPEHGLDACTDFEVKVLSAVALRASFTCINLREGRISFDDYAMPGGDKALIRLLVKNPLKVVIDFINKHKKHHH